MRQYLHSVQEQFKPKYHELTAYLTALTCALLFIFYSRFRQGYFGLFEGGVFVIPAVVGTLGFFLSFIEVFIEGEKTWFEKTSIGAFIMGANGFAGIAAGMEMLPAPWSLLGVIALWNVFMGVIMLYQIGAQNFTVTDEETSRVEVIVTSIILLILFAITDFGLHLSWAMTFSICIFYSSTILFVFKGIMYYFRPQPLSKKRHH